ncbi:hypothetical protein LCGC14_0998610 [marine sediment metagenome]|uniref:Uncharacterized protein n=1 Tax=marine sediment metagenome TaxID=412755 RepID=A0A0F9N3L2_9ZZZZ
MENKKGTSTYSSLIGIGLAVVVFIVTFPIIEDSLAKAGDSWIVSNFYSILGGSVLLGIPIAFYGYRIKWPWLQWKWYQSTRDFVSKYSFLLVIGVSVFAIVMNLIGE